MSVKVVSPIVDMKNARLTISLRTIARVSI
jgi:hypothetical protein